MNVVSFGFCVVLSSPSPTSSLSIRVLLYLQRYLVGSFAVKRDMHNIFYLKVEQKTAFFYLSCLGLTFRLRRLHERLSALCSLYCFTGTWPTTKIHSDYTDTKTVYSHMWWVFLTYSNLLGWVRFNHWFLKLNEKQCLGDGRCGWTSMIVS